jgi:2-polyprenyl-3-methyl-5-hydroxy-6-metoxy-1,4-benzoquinol methylase
LLLNCGGPVLKRLPVSVKEKYKWQPQACPICEVPPSRFLGRRGGDAHRAQLGEECEIWSCGHCGLIFPHPMPRPTGGLEQHYGVDADEYFQHFEIEAKTRGGHGLLRRAQEITGGKGKLLDIGAGRGELLLAAREQGWDAIGIEPSRQFATYAAKHSGASIRSEPLEQCNFETDSFDVVILSAVLEHLYEPDATVREIARILRKGGALFVDVPNEGGLYFVLGNLYERLRGRDWVVNLAPTFSPFHVFGFNPKSLRAMLRKHGLKPVYWRVYGGRAMVPTGGSLLGKLEHLAAHSVTAVSNFGSLGTYIETWAIKQ